MTGKLAERPTYEYDEDGVYCWLNHQWEPWRLRDVETEGWERKTAKELYRSCYRCPKFQVKEVP